MAKVRPGEEAGESLRRLAGAERLPVREIQAWTAAGFLSADECDGLIRRIDADRAPSGMFLNRDGADPSFRTSETCWMDHSDPLVDAVSRRLCAALGLPSSHAERLQGQRYEAGQRFGPHTDYFLTDRPYWAEQRRMGGQRTWTAMIFLDRPKAGGETHFPRLDVTVAPEAGKLLAWDNLSRDGEPNPQTLHEGRPVEAGVKHIVTLWFRERPCRKPGLRAALRRSAGGAVRLVLGKR